MALTKPRGRNGGRSSNWRSATKMMRLPARHEAEIFVYAHRLDSGEPVPGDELQQAIDAVLLSLRPGDRKSARSLFKKLLRRLEPSAAGSADVPLELAGHRKDKTRLQGRLPL